MSSAFFTTSAAERRAPADEETILAAGMAERRYWRELWRYRGLLAALARRDLSVRYKQTAIGVAWALIRPFLAIVVFTLVFGRIARLPSEGGAPYALLVQAGMLPWLLVSGIVSEAGGSLVAAAPLLSKVYFPRLVAPAAAAAVALADFAVNLAMAAALTLVFRFNPGWRAALLPLFAALALLVSLGPALWIAALNVKYRDFRYVIPVLLQFGVYVSPVGFSSAAVPEGWRFWFALNPLVGVIDGFRWCLLGGASAPSALSLAASLGEGVVFLALGLRAFRAAEKTFADHL